MSERIRIGTRGSALALWQANEVARRLDEQGYGSEIITFKTSGDKRQDVSLASIGGKGVFVKELEEALDRREIDAAVHSLKDVPSLVPERFALAGFLERGDTRDVWIHSRHMALQDVPDGSTVGTSSPRRRAQLLAPFPRLNLVPIRGNVDSRIRKVREGLFDGIVLAAAGVERLELTSEITSYFSVDEMVPAAGQGIVAIETLAQSDRARHAAQSITDEASRVAATCERSVLQRFGEQLDCYSAVAVHATVEAVTITVRAFFSDFEGTRAIRVRHSGRNPERVVNTVYEDLISQGARELLYARR